MITVSVLMITFGHEKFIQQAIESVLMQHCDCGVELIIADDCSPDDTEKIVNNVIQTHHNGSWIKYTKHNKNKGTNANFIWAAEKAQGKFIAICEGDDYWVDPNKLQKQIDFLEANEEYVITYTRATAFDEEGTIDRKLGAERDLSNEELIKCSGLNTLTACFRNVVDKYPMEMYSAHFQDLFLWSLLGHFGKGKFLNDILPSMYRVHSGGTFSMQNSKRRKAMSLGTNHSLYAYYTRIGNKELARSFEDLFVRSVISTVGPMSFFKIFGKRIISKLITRIKSFFK